MSSSGKSSSASSSKLRLGRIRSEISDRADIIIFVIIGMEDGSFFGDGVTENTIFSNAWQYGLYDFLQYFFLMFKNYERSYRKL